MLIYKMKDGFSVDADSSDEETTRSNSYMGIIFNNNICKAEDIFWLMDMSHDPSDSLFTFTDNIFSFLHLKIISETDEYGTFTRYELTEPSDDSWDYHKKDKKAEWLTWQQIEMWMETFGFLPDHEDQYNDFLWDQDEDWKAKFALKAKAVKGKLAVGDDGKPLPDVSVDNLKYFITEKPDPKDSH